MRTINIVLAISLFSFNLLVSFESWSENNSQVYVIGEEGSFGSNKSNSLIFDVEEAIIGHCTNPDFFKCKDKFIKKTLRYCNDLTIKTLKGINYSNAEQGSKEFRKRLNKLLASGIWKLNRCELWMISTGSSKNKMEELKDRIDELEDQIDYLENQLNDE